MRQVLQKVIIGLILIAPFSNFLFTKLDIWYTQGYFVQLCILTLFGIRLYLKSKPFGMLFTWAGLLTLSYCVATQVSVKQLPILLFLPFFNLVCIAVLFDTITSFAKKETYETILKWYPIILLVVSVYAILQKLNLDQFLTHFNTKYFPDQVVGTMGNQMHFSHYLTICLPMLFCWVNKYRNPLIVLVLFAMVLSGSFSGLLIAIVLIITYSFYNRLFSNREICLFLTLVVLVLLFKRPDLGFISNSGRYAIWEQYLNVFKDKPITGWGIGIVNALASKEGAFYGWRHLHNEFFHFTVELGLVGLGIIVWGIVDYFKRMKRDPISISINLVFVAFLMCSLFGFPAHLWVLSTLGLLAYSFNYLGE